MTYFAANLPPLPLASGSGGDWGLGAAVVPLLFVLVVACARFGGLWIGLVTAAAAGAAVLLRVLPGSGPHAGPAEWLVAAGLLAAAALTGSLVAARRRAEDALRERQARLRLLSEQIPAVLWSTDTDLHVTSGFGAALAARTGADADALLRHLSAAGGGAGADPAAAAAHAAALRGEPGTYDVVWQDLTFRSHVEPLRSADAAVVGVVGVALDITDRIAAERRLLAAKEEAETAARARDRFLAMLSHELRTPLTPALLTVAALATDERLDAAARDDLARVRRNIELEATLIDDLLDVARITHGKLAVDLRPAGLHDLLRAALDTCGPAIAGKGIDVALDLRADRELVRADDARLRQVFWNLIKNAVKFTPPGGRVTLRTLNPDPRHVRVEVADTGVGIDPAVLPHVFEPFQQGGARVTREFGGLGLGLAISRSLVEAHGGTLAAHSAGRDRGATFAVELRTVDPGDVPASTPEPTRPAVTRAARGVRILLVEDDADTARVLGRLLAAAGHAVRTADSVAAATAVARAEPFDVLVSDLGLPDGTGIDLMRSLAGARPVRGVAVSGFGTEADRQESLAAGFAEHLTKPVAFEDLERAIERVAG